MASTLAKSPTTSELLKDRINGLTLDEIGDKHGLSHQAVSQRLKGLFEFLDGEKLKSYRENRIALFEAAEAKLLCEMFNTARLEKATLGNIAYGLTQVHTARRLEAGQSTQNISLRELVEDLAREARVVDQAQPKAIQ